MSKLAFVRCIMMQQAVQVTEAGAVLLDTAAAADLSQVLTWSPPQGTTIILATANARYDTSTQSMTTRS